MTKHKHGITSELGIFHIPADPRQPMSYKLIDPNLDGMRRAIGGGYVEKISTPFMPLLECLCRAVLIVDEDGFMKNLLDNPRASLFCPRWQIVGDAFLVGLGPDPTGEPDFFSLPPAFRDYKGGRMSPAENRKWMKS